EGQVLARKRVLGGFGQLQHQKDRKCDQPHAGKHRRHDPRDDLHLAVDTQALHDPVQGPGHDGPLEDQRQRRGAIAMVGTLDPTATRYGARQKHGMKREGVQRRVDPVLVDHHEADQDEAPGQEVRDVEIQPMHRYRLLETKSRRVPSSPRISATPRKSGTRKTRILAIDVSNSASSAPPAASFSTKIAPPMARPPTPALAGAMPQGKNTQPISAM